MKKILSLFLAFTIMLSLCACQGNFGSVNLNEAIEIPENGIIKESVIKKIQSENAIGVFSGESNGLRYEWTIFGSDLKDTKDVNLSITLEKTEKGIKIKFFFINKFTHELSTVTTRKGGF